MDSQTLWYMGTRVDRARELTKQIAEMESLVAEFKSEKRVWVKVSRQLRDYCSAVPRLEHVITNNDTCDWLQNRYEEAIARLKQELSEI